MPPQIRQRIQCNTWPKRMEPKRSKQPKSLAQLRRELSEKKEGREDG